MKSDSSTGRKMKGLVRVRGRKRTKTRLDDGRVQPNAVRKPRAGKALNLWCPPALSAREQAASNSLPASLPATNQIGSERDWERALLLVSLTGHWETTQGLKARRVWSSGRCACTCMMRCSMKTCRFVVDRVRVLPKGLAIWSIHLLTRYFNMPNTPIIM